MSSSNYLDKVKKLRELTGVGFKDCSIAIQECEGDIDKSVEYLRIKGISKARKKTERVANDGLVCVYEKNNGRVSAKYIFHENGKVQKEEASTGCHPKRSAYS